MNNLDITGMTLSLAKELLTANGYIVQNVICMQNDKQLSALSNRNGLCFQRDKSKPLNKIKSSDTNSEQCVNALPQPDYSRFTEIVVRADFSGCDVILTTTYFLMENFDVCQA